jgi:phosphatidate phosphatase APP1
MIVFFPTYARPIPGERRWRANVAGMVTRPLPPKSRRRSMALAVLKRLLDLDEPQLESEVFRRRADAFFFQRVAGLPVRISVGGRLIDAGQTDRAGHFQTSFELDDDAVGALSTGAGSGCRWIAYEGLCDEFGDEEEPATRDDGGGLRPAAGSGRIQVVDANGTSVISDIDDTVKVTNVANRRELLANTFVREFRSVPGMVEVYRRWQEGGTAFHYVSASPWQLADCLCGFLAAAGLPAGSMHLKLFRLKDSTPLGRLPSRKRSKRRTIEQIMDEFPGRRFLLVGDSGERDPEVYAAIARRRPEQVAGIVIRQVEGRASREKVRSRLDRLARRVQSVGMTIFNDAEELADMSLQ